jgi:lysozyme
MKINQAGIDLIKRWEGLRLKAYTCPAGVWTIGYGHTGDVEPGDVITAHQADVILEEIDIPKHADDVFDLLVERGVNCNENQFAALVSFAFNLGVGRLAHSTLLEKFVAGDLVRYDRRGEVVGGAAAEFRKWKFAAGKVMPGLVARREAEMNLFLTPVAA